MRLFILKCTKNVRRLRIRPLTLLGELIYQVPRFSPGLQWLYHVSHLGLFSPVTSCRPHSAFQCSAYDYSIISSFCAILPKTCYILAHVQMLCYLLTYSAPSILPSCFKLESRKGPKDIFRGTNTVEPLHQILAKAPSLGLYLDHITCIFEKRRFMLRQKMQSLKMHQNC